jgi:hypothetical protein
VSGEFVFARVLHALRKRVFPEWTKAGAAASAGSIPI